MVMLQMHNTPTSLKAYVLRYKGAVAKGFLCVLGSISLGLFIPYITGRVIDGLESGTFDQRSLLELSLTFLVASLCMIVCSVLMRRIMLGAAQHVESDIRRDVFNNLTKMDHAFYQRERTGDIMTKMSSDLVSVKEMVGQGLLQGSRILIAFPMTFAIMFYMNAYLALVIMAIIPAISLAFFYIVRVIRKRYDHVQDQFSAISNFCQESFSGIRPIKGFGIEKRMRERFRKLNEEYIDLNMSLTRVEEPIWPFMMFMFGVGTLLLLLLGGRLVIQGTISLGEFVQFQQYLIFLQWPMLAIGWVLNLFQRGTTSWKRILTLIDAQPDIGDGENTDKSLTAIAGGINLKAVRYAVDDTELLQDINLDIPEGQVLGITGPTGSGKTLLVSLMCRLIDPSSGIVWMGGKDIRSFPLSVLRSQIGLAPQEAFLFSDTLANNIALGLPPMDSSVTVPHEDKVLWASDIANLSADVDRFPEKYATMLGERGVTLSGGQRQRTAISRAIALKPNVLILDDVFSAVDTQTEAQILNQLLPVLRERTAVLVSHRVSTLKHADRVIVMDKGRIVQDGTHDELVSTAGYYQDQHEMQRLEAQLEEGMS